MLTLGVATVIFLVNTVMLSTKIVYLGHRRFLSPDDALHADRRKFPHKKDLASQSIIKTQRYIDKAIGN